MRGVLLQRQHGSRVARCCMPVDAAQPSGRRPTDPNHPPPLPHLARRGLQVLHDVPSTPPVHRGRHADGAPARRVPQSARKGAPASLPPADLPPFALLFRCPSGFGALPVSTMFPRFVDGSPLGLGGGWERGGRPRDDNARRPAGRSGQPGRGRGRQRCRREHARRTGRLYEAKEGVGRALRR